MVVQTLQCYSLSSHAHPHPRHIAFLFGAFIMLCECGDLSGVYLPSRVECKLRGSSDFCSSLLPLVPKCLAYCRHLFPLGWTNEWIQTGLIYSGAKAGKQLYLPTAFKGFFGPLIIPLGVALQYICLIKWSQKLSKKSKRCLRCTDFSHQGYVFISQKKEKEKKKAITQ